MKTGGDVAYALVRAASPLVAMLGLDALFARRNVSRWFSTRRARVRTPHEKSRLESESYLQFQTPIVGVLGKIDSTAAPGAAPAASSETVTTTQLVRLAEQR
jgi:hypothetical protein